MAYEPTVWTCGDTISAERLNKLEEGVAQIMSDYVPTEWACGDVITADDLNRLENGVEEALDGGSVDCGYSCSEGWITLTDESVTTVASEDGYYAHAQLSYSEPIEADTIKVTFNGTEYTCTRDSDGGYGAPSDDDDIADWSTYPFYIIHVPPEGLTFITTETAGTYQVKIESYEETIETSECFDKARGYSCSDGDTVTLVDETVTFNSAQ